LEFTVVILKQFNINSLSLKFFVGINQIKFDYQKFSHFYNLNDKKKSLNKFFEIIEEIQYNHNNSVIQFVKDKYLLNQDHLFTACYYVEKSFLQNINISNRKNIELLLYLAANRQISKSIEAFGIEFVDLRTNELTYCIVSPLNNIEKINNDLSEILDSKETEFKINNKSISKINSIKQYFEISDKQINSVLKSYGISLVKSGVNLNFQILALYDLICEKMALLHLEKVKVD
jgi:tRNA threonylcarbamoyladenosine modification (KEOPS) complex Cgi121 subunit